MATATAARSRGRTAATRKRASPAANGTTAKAAGAPHAAATWGTNEYRRAASLARYAGELEAVARGDGGTLDIADIRVMARQGWIERDDGGAYRLAKGVQTFLTELRKGD